MIRFHHELSAERLPETAHVEQDGNYFFVTARKTAYAEVEDDNPTLMVFEVPVEVGLDEASGRRAQDVARFVLLGLGCNPTFDY